MYTLEEIKTIAIPVAIQFGVKKLALFGSYAQDKATEASDLDFLISKGEIRGLTFFDFINQLEDAFEMDVDVLTYESLERSLIKDDVTKMVVLYEA